MFPRSNDGAPGGEMTHLPRASTLMEAQPCSPSEYTVGLFGNLCNIYESHTKELII